MNEATSRLVQQLQLNILIIVSMLIFNIGLHLFNLLFWKGTLKNYYAIIPREQFSFARICLSPFVHGNRFHLFGNMMPLMMLGSIATFPDIQLFILATMVIIFISGLGIWLFGQKGGHIGASGLVLGYFSFILTRGLLELALLPVLVALIIAGFYRRLFGQIVVLTDGISTAGHIFGTIGGILAAWCIAWVKANQSL